MQWIYIICFALISAGLLALFGVRPGDFIDALFRSQRKAATLSDELNVLMGTPAKGFFNQDYELKQILKGTGRSDRYEAVKRLSLILFAVGAVLALLINNVYMLSLIHISSTIAEAGEGNAERATTLLKELMVQYIVKRKYAIEGLTTEELCEKLYEDMAGYSFLKKWIYKPGIEEVNINAYNDIEAVSYTHLIRS